MSEIILDMPDEDYRKEKGVSISALKYIQRSPAAYLHAIRTKSKSTAAQVFGRVLHGICLEPHRTLHVVRPDGMTFVTKEGKAWRDAQTLPILTKEEHDDAHGAANALMEHPVAGPIIKASQKEVSAFDTDKETGLRLKGRADLVYTNTQGLTILADIKTAEDASEKEFVWSAIRYGYPRQAAYYLDLFGASKFLFIAVEKEAPYGVQVFEVSETKLDQAREMNRENLKTLKQCLETDTWPSYSAEIKLI